MPRPWVQIPPSPLRFFGNCLRSSMDKSSRFLNGRVAGSNPAEGATDHPNGLIAQRGYGRTVRQRPAKPHILVRIQLPAPAQITLCVTRKGKEGRAMDSYPAVLVLNASYEALDLVSWENAIVLVVKDKAIIHQAHESRIMIHSEYLSVPLPAVIVLKRYVLVPHRDLDEHDVASLTAILRRDKNTCGYCGDFASTVDHIQPKSRDGLTTWGNCIAACFTCNQLKADLTPEEAGMRLLWPPRVPSREPLTQRQVWKQIAASA